MYKALITDIDGTVIPISSDGEAVDQTTKEAVKKALRQGKKLTCATGREWEIAKDVVQALGLTSPCIVEGGTRIVNPLTEETMWEKALSEHAAQEILEIFHLHSKEGQVMHSLDISRHPLEEVREVPTHLRFIYLLAVTEGTAIAISNSVNQRQDTAAHFTPSWMGKGLVDIHVTHRSATKEHAIQIWQQLEKVSQVETIGMGDSGNDLPIFQSAGLKIAVGNATANLKELADYISPPVTEHALKHVIERFLLDK